ncbi:MAG: ATP-binding protein [Methylovirgula sp.]|uniref:sensor histidine kinase n=1 Tax=Methylovirgula sp. TaxID=1978224 RepID=UPI003075F38B
MRIIPWGDLSAVVLNAQDAIFGQTFDGDIASWNAGAERLFGYTAGEAVGQPAFMLAADPDSWDLTSIIERLRRGESTPPYEDEFRHKDGSTLPATVAISPVMVSGEAIGISQVVRRGVISSAPDNSLSLSKLESEREELRHQLLHLARLGAMAQMSTALAHELYQPLTAIVAYLTSARRLMNRGQTTLSEADLLMIAMDRAIEQASRADQIIRHLRFFVADQPDERQLSSIRETILNVNDLVLIVAKEADVRIELNLEDDAQVLINRVQIQQALLNLMRNAVEAMAGGTRRQLSVFTSSADGNIVVTIADSGPGLSPEIADQLFTPFKTTKPDGMGVGLSICQTIIVAHGGDLWLDPSATNGATFRFKLPIVE